MKTNKTLCSLVVLLLLVTSRGEAAAAGLISGEQIKFSDPPRWTTSGEWDFSGERLLVADVLRGDILQYSSDGKLVNSTIADALPNPGVIQRAGSDSLWVESEDGHLFELSRDLQARPRPLINLLEKVKSTHGTLISVFNWVPLSPSEILVFGDLRREQGDIGAVLRVPLQDPASYTILREIEIETLSHRFFLLGQPFLGAVHGEPYFLVMADTPQIVKPGGTGFRIVQITASGRKEPYGRPELPENVTMSTAALLFKQLERSTSAAGLYGWRGFLYMLKRKPAGDGKTMWSLLKIDPKTNKILWTRRIDSSANHLLVVPGEKYWAFVEKGPVVGPGNQEISSFLRVPVEVIETP